MLRELEPANWNKGIRPFETAHIEHVEIELEISDTGAGKNPGRLWLTVMADACKWRVCDVYHQKKHHSLGMPPETMWELNVRTEDIRFPADRECLNIVMGRPYPRVLTHKGIEFKGLYYGSDALHHLRHLYGATLDVQIRVDESDIGEIHVLYGDEIVIARALRDDYAVGLSLWLHE
ncbi:Mu transposase C-terminal domain-containing protein [Edaphobacter modestus]|uniref:Mu transposase C-terminal domain-containing protein n=1 Tax=Edaphobacter modestus TaxID=388466 RepID=UPI00102ABDFE|nr:Mu transposase C-terminal domain-containing protein [Edaphobacter modestus]